MGLSSRTRKAALGGSTVEICASSNTCEIQCKSALPDTNLVVRLRDRRGHVCGQQRIPRDCLRLVVRYGYPMMSEIQARLDPEVLLLVAHPGEESLVCPHQLQGPARSRLMAYFEALVSSIFLVLLGTLGSAGSVPTT